MMHASGPKPLYVVQIHGAWVETKVQMIESAIEKAPD